MMELLSDLQFFHRGRVSGLLSLSNAGFLVIERLAHIVEISTGTNADVHAEKGEKTERGRGEKKNSLKCINGVS
jgi:hypothetical protein